jgi:3-oxoadipate enol-lactonase
MFANGIGINCAVEGSGPPLVLIHALGLDHRQWRRQVADFARYREVFAYDLRGHGQSDKPSGPYTLEQMADDLNGLLVGWGIRRAQILGLSLGGMVAQTFALDYPEMVSSLVLADTTSEYPPEARRMFDERARLIKIGGMDDLVESTLDRWFTPDYRRTDAATVDEIRQILRAADPTGYAACCEAIARIDLTARLARIQAPTLVIVGAEDPGTPVTAAQRLHDAIPDSRLTVISGASHLSNVSHAAEFNAAVREFLTR